MDAIRKIEEALAAGPTETEWRPLVTRIDDARGYQICHFDLHGKSEKERDANRALVVACQPAAIREVLQTLASKDAEIARLKNAGAQLANCAFNLSQTAGQILSERSAKTLKLAQTQWDAALTQPTEQP